MQRTLSKEWKEPTEFKKILVNHISDKKLMSRIHKELYNSTIKRLITQFKNGKKRWPDIYLKKTYKCPINIWKDGQFYYALGKCKLRPQDITLYPPGLL